VLVIVLVIVIVIVLVLVIVIEARDSRLVSIALDHASDNMLMVDG